MISQEISSVKSQNMLKGRLFIASLMLVSVLPLILILLEPIYKAESLFLVNAFLILGSLHVFETTYLFVDPDIRKMFAENKIKLILMPSILIVFGVLVLGNPSNPFYNPAVIANFFYQAWHFGSQNIGCASFTSMFYRKSGLSSFEKKIIQLGTLCGVFGILEVALPQYGAGNFSANLDKSTLEFIANLYLLGKIGAILVTIISMYISISLALRGYIVLSISYFISSTFLFVMYLTKNFWVGFMSFVIAHGLQYLIFLFAHASLGRGNLLKQLLFFGCLLFVAYFLWWVLLPPLTIYFLPLLGVAFVQGITLAHFWIDQVIWRMNTPARRSWVRKRYNFIF